MLQVLDEIGIEISGKLAATPAAATGRIGDASKTKNPTDDELERQLAALKDL